MRVGIAKEKRLSGDTSVVSLFYITYYMSEKGETPPPQVTYSSAVLHVVGIMNVYMYF